MTRVALAAVCSVAALLACGEPAAPRPPDVWLISADTLRADHLGCYGYLRDTTPNLDALAARGALFERAFSASSWTLPAHASMLTGLYPVGHGLRDDGVALPPQVPTLAEGLRRLGYHGVATVSHVYVSSAFGLDRGFEVFDDSLTRGGTRNPRAARVVARFLEHVRAAPDAPVFGFVHFFDPHWGYTPPPPYDTRFADPGYDGPIDGSYASMERFLTPDAPMAARDLRALVAGYDAEIAYLDAQLGRLFEGLRAAGRLENAVVVFTADHGEEFKEHGGLGHGLTLYGEQLRVPLLIAGHPAFPPGTRRRDPVSPVDLLPTLLEIAGAPRPGASDGRSLLAPARDDDRPLFAESIRFGIVRRAVRRGHFKLIHSPETGRREYFDLRSDAGEQRPLGEDPSGGVLDRDLAEHVAAADSGWHLKLIGAGAHPLRFRGQIRSSGRLVDPRRYFSRQLAGRRVEFDAFDLAGDGRSLRLEGMIASHVGEVAFETDPPDAAVTFDLALESGPDAAGLYLGAGEPAAGGGGAVTLERADPRLIGQVDPHGAAPGAYVRAVSSRASAPPSQLSPEAVESLEALGYVDGPAGAAP